MTLSRSVRSTAMGFGELQKSIEDKLLALHFAKEEKPTEEEKKAPRIAIYRQAEWGKARSSTP